MLTGDVMGRERIKKNGRDGFSRTEPFLQRLECLPGTYWAKEDSVAALVLGPPLGT